jgi:hypothetical protein
MTDIEIIDYYRDDVSELESVCVLEDGTEMSFFQYVDYLLKKFPHKTKYVGYDKIFDGKDNKLTVEDIKNMIRLGLLEDTFHIID